MAVRFKFRIPLEPFIVCLLATVALASFLPCRGRVADGFDALTTFAIALLFFLHGAKLSREAIVDGIGNWRLHLCVLAATFVVFPIIGIGVRAIFSDWVNPAMLAGVLFLCLLPSTVQSSIAFTSIAGGNVPAAVCSASASNVIGMFVTPLLVSLLLGAKGSGVSMGAIEAILFQLLAPFIAGHLSRGLTARFLHKQKRLVNLVDRGSILLVVYTAFSAAIVQGLWHVLSVGDLVIVTLLDGLVLALVLTITTFAARRLGFNRQDEIAIVFCGSKKSLASGVPIAGVLFPAASVGAMIVPLMLFHQMQLMVCAVLARRYAHVPGATQSEFREAV
jgi:sodium/bile acid cotransporter 7